MFDKLFLQRNYADNLSSRLEGWRIQNYSPYKANFRCGICGDSQKNKFKKRGYILEKGGHLVYYCHNACGTIGFEKYLKEHHDDLYTMYRLDMIQELKEGYQKEQEVKEEEIRILEVSAMNIPNVQEVDRAFGYIKKRGIAERFWDDIYFTDKFYDFANDKIPEMFPESYMGAKEERVIFPMRWFNGEIFGAVCRSIKKDTNLRYVTLKFDDTKPKIFGLDRVDRFEPVVALEGAIDTFHVSNSIAMAGTDGNPYDVFDKKQVIIALDNQPRHKDVLRKYEKYIDMGCNIVIWPKSIKGKDPNEMVLTNELTEDKLNTIIHNNSHSGVMAKIKFNDWKMV